MENKLIIINNKIALNTSDSKETLDNTNQFLKGGAMTAIWNDVVNYMTLDEFLEIEN